MIIEGFRIIMYDTIIGLVLKCTFQEEGSENFYGDIKLALAALDEQRSEAGFQNRKSSLRESQRGFIKGKAGRNWTKRLGK